MQAALELIQPDGNDLDRGLIAVELRRALEYLELAWTRYHGIPTMGQQSELTIDDVAAVVRRVKHALEVCNRPASLKEIDRIAELPAFTPADVALLADIADGFSTVLHYDRLDELRKRMAAAVAARSNAGQNVPAPAPLPVKLLPWCPPNVRARLFATSALGKNPGSGAECVQLTIVCPPLVAGGSEYLQQLQSVGKEFLEAIVKDRIDVLDEDAAQVRRVQAVLEGEEERARHQGDGDRRGLEVKS